MGNIATLPFSEYQGAIKLHKPFYKLNEEKRRTYHFSVTEVYKCNWEKEKQEESNTYKADKRSTLATLAEKAIPFSFYQNNDFDSFSDWEPLNKADNT